MALMCDNGADRDFQELLRATTRGDVALDLPGGLWCSAVPESPLTEFRTPPTDAQTEFDAILGMEATIETHLPGSIHFMHRAQNVNGEDSKSHCASISAIPLPSFVRC